MSALATLWKCPVPISAIQGPHLRELHHRQYEVSFTTEDQEFTLHFNGVAAFMCTHLRLLTVEMLSASYGRVVDLGETKWLADSMRFANRDPREPVLRLRNLQICFDDGPCYEFLCEGFAEANA
jgi:hypothetical protein